MEVIQVATVTRILAIEQAIIKNIGKTITPGDSRKIGVWSLAVIATMTIGTPTVQVGKG